MKFAISKLAFRFTVLFFFLLGFASSSMGQEIELRISRNDILNPGLKKEFWFHLVSNATDSIRGFTFGNGYAISLYMVDSSGKLISYPRFLSHKGDARQRTFYISPGDHSGVIVPLKDFGIKKSGIHFMIFIIPDPRKPRIIFSKPSRVFISDALQIEEVDAIPIEEIPESARNTFRKELEQFLREEKLPLSSIKLPF